MRPFGRRASQGRVSAMPLYRRLQIQTRQRRHKQQGEKVEVKARTIPDFVDFAASWVAFMFFMNFVASWLAFTNKTLFALLYLISFWNFARLLCQASMHGDFVDKFAERLSPRLLLVFLSCIYKRYSRLFYGLMLLDDARERFQRFSIYQARKKKHKDMACCKSKLVTFFNQHKWFKGYCCVGAEVLYLLLYCIADEGSDSLMNVVQKAIMGSPMWGILTMIVLTAWAIKQFVNVVQLCSAVADVFAFNDSQKANTHQTQTLPERSFIVQVDAVDGGGGSLGSTQKRKEI